MLDNGNRVLVIDLNRIYIHQCVIFGQLFNYDTT